ncbi:acetyltransferase [Clostridium perfringens]|uniref:acetyltransferase n=1 Tax=Clostridium perfringens TaxID=1502 RepID=UPI00115AADB4|nr:acetyltransferase [Clostridium perfringens]MBI6074876.1 acetyltransferase [Clostridium perfringens]MDM0926224.1 acetyltransferase [Clostridium perfringens]MDZ4996977.1 transferase [Clostridium perfringens]UBK89262.1 acetyltransferase [Clostridium perfringens]HBC2029493.1 acetyltransferase [Clostridium perfringens]
MKDLVIVGAGGFGREVAWLVEQINEVSKEWNLIGFIDENKEMHETLINGYKVLGGIDWLKDKDIYYVCAIGNSKIRKDIVERINKFKLKAATIIHPSVLINKKYVEVGEGCIICASSILTVNIKLGKHVILNLDCTVGHDAILKDFVTVYPSVNISGNCIIDKCVELGTGTQIIQGKTIGENTIIGAGSVVIKNIEKNRTAVGIPAKTIK